MHHRHIQQQLILYLDGELAEQEMVQIKEHLAQCSDCRLYVETMASVWEQTPVRETPSPYLWNRVEARILEVEKPRTVLSDIFQHLGMLTRPAMMVATLAVGILLGAYLGNMHPEDSEVLNPQMAVQDRENSVNASYLESFNDMPPESVGQTYMLISSDNE